MKIFLNIFALLFCAVLLFSCEPRSDENGDYLFGVDQNPGQTGGGGTGGGNTSDRLLKKVISKGINEDTGEWETETINFSYVDRKLVSYDDGSGEKFNFEYNSNNKISKLFTTGQNALFEYANGNLSKVTTDIDGAAKIVATYTYTAGKLTKAVSIQEFFIPLPIKMYLETSYEYNGENMVKSTIKNGFYLPNGELQMNPTEDQALNFTYDAKNSPYKLLPTEFIIWMAGIGPQGGAFLSANNINTIKISVGGISTPASTYTHAYDSANYPIKSTADTGEISEYEYQ